MKKIILILPIFFSIAFFSQVTIGKNADTNNLVSNNPSIILEFSNAEKKGIVLPWVTSISEVENSANNLDSAGNPLSTVDGTLIFDSSDQKIKARLNGVWKDLSGTNAPVITPTSPNVLDATLVEQKTARTIIGDPNSTAAGILVLESPNQAMILPKVTNYTDIVNPSAGMMVYVTTNKRLACFNGKVWSFWRP